MISVFMPSHLVFFRHIWSKVFIGFLTESSSSFMSHLIAILTFISSDVSSIILGIWWCWSMGGNDFENLNNSGERILFFDAKYNLFIRIIGTQSALELFVARLYLNHTWRTRDPSRCLGKELHANAKCSWGCFCARVKSFNHKNDKKLNRNQLQRTIVFARSKLEALRAQLRRNWFQVVRNSWCQYPYPFSFHKMGFPFHSGVAWNYLKHEFGQLFLVNFRPIWWHSYSRNLILTEFFQDFMIV